MSKAEILESLLAHGSALRPIISRTGLSQLVIVSLLGPRSFWIE